MDIDFLLIQKMKHGDENAFDVFVHKYYKKILDYCVYHCMDKLYAEDLTQETFVRFFAKLSDYRYRGKTINYLYTIAGNLCKDYFKKTKDSMLDEQIVENNGCFTVSSDGIALVVKKEDGPADIECNIQGLTALVVGRQNFKDTVDAGVVKVQSDMDLRFAEMLFGERHIHMNRNF